MLELSAFGKVTEPLGPGPFLFASKKQVPLYLVICHVDVAMKMNCMP